MPRESNKIIGVGRAFADFDRRKFPLFSAVRREFPEWLRVGSESELEGEADVAQDRSGSVAGAFFTRLAKLYYDAGQPPYVQIVDFCSLNKVRVTDSSIEDWISGRRVPRSRKPFTLIVQHLTKLAQARHRSYDAPPLSVWEGWRRQAQRERNSGASEPPAAAAAPGYSPAPDAESNGPRPTAPLRTISQWSPVDLGVHRVIEATQDAWESRRNADEVLTRYVGRRHDRRLRDRLREAHEGAAVFVSLVGGSCTGKTRALFEAVADRLPDWPVLVPRDAAELRQWVDDDCVDARSVLWLDETTRFLPGAAAHLLALLGRAGPLVVLASNWPNAGNPLTDKDNADIKALVKRYQPEVPVAGFDEQGWEELRRLALVDPRVSAALAAADADGSVIPHLTGGPELVEFYRDPAREFFTAVERAVITAALDARRLGHRRPVPATLLAEAAAGYLTGHQRITEDPSWIDTVLHSICSTGAKRVKGALTALIPDRSAPDFGPAEGYHPEDYLLQHAAESRRAVRLPAELWEALVTRTADETDVERVADAALERIRYGPAGRLYRRLATGDAPSARQLARLLFNGRDVGGAIAVLEPWSSSNRRAAMLLAEMRQKTHAYDEAIAALAPWIDGNLPARQFHMYILAERGDHDYLRAEAAGPIGDQYALEAIARVLEERGDLDALNELRDLIDGNYGLYVPVLFYLGPLLVRHGKVAELRDRAERVSFDPYMHARLLAASGDMAGLRERLHSVRGNEAWLLALAGDTEGLRDRAEAGDAEAAGMLEDMSTIDDPQQAALAEARLESLLREVEGGSIPTREIVRLLRRLRRSAEAERLERFGLRLDGSIAAEPTW